MNTINQIISDIGIVPVIKLNNPERDAAPLAKALCAGGVPVAEITFRAAGADMAIALMKEACPEMTVGAGTVISKEHIDLVIAAGGQFIVTPGFDPELVSYAQEKKIPIYPGCTTPTDYHSALKYGLQVLKFFPAEQSGGLAKIKAMSAPFPQFKIMPTGGISLKNLAQYTASPIIAACGGSYMVTSDLIDSQNWKEITNLCQKSRDIVKTARRNAIEKKAPETTQKAPAVKHPLGKIVTFGELMIRLQPYNYERFVQADHLEFSFGGGEANVAVSLANYGMDAAFVTKLPAHAIGQAAVNSLRRYGVDTTRIVRGGERIGIYFNEKGASQRGSVCIYDRAHSAIQESSTADFDWDAIFQDVEWFHFTGITPALGPNLVDICREACKTAKAKGIKISCDLNYRGKLWTQEQAREAMTDLCQYVDVCISNEEDAKDVFGIEAESTDITAGTLNREGYRSVARQLADKFGFEKVAITLRESHSASDNGWSAMLYDAVSGQYCFSKNYALHIVDRVGGGDSFGGGLIYSLLTGKDTQEAIEFATAASALKHSVEGDYNMVTVAEVDKLAGGDDSGRIQR